MRRLTNYQMYLVGEVTDSINLANLDVDGDGMFTIQDVTAIQVMIAS